MRHVYFFSNIDLTIETVGSCCTLIAEKLLQSKFEFLCNNAALLLYGNLLNLLISLRLFIVVLYVTTTDFAATIVLDTVNFSPAAKKITDKDLQVVKSLEKVLPNVSNDELFREIQKAKSNVSGRFILSCFRYLHCAERLI